jgi:predicted AAA+ superfamily ATPase
MAKTKPWHEVIKLRPDILSGELSQKEFAADLYDVMMDRNRSVYHDPKRFFELTYPTTRLRELARDVVLRLAGKSEKAVRQLQLT